MKRKTLRWIAMLVLLCLALTACGGKQAGSETGGDPSGSDPATAEDSGDKAGKEDPEESKEPEEPADYSKYNTYIDLSDEIYDIEAVLTVYFENVEYQESFALVEGGDYANIKEALEWYTPMTHTAEEALEYADEEPSYPEVDKAVKDLGTSVEDVMDALNAIGSYVRFDDYEEDSLAQAPKLHADLWKACQTYDAYSGDFLSAIETMAAESRDEDEAELLEDGELVLYHSTCMIHSSQDILDDIWTQIMAAPQTGEEFTLPAIDMTGLSPLFDKFQTAYEGFGQAMGIPEEKEKVFNGKLADPSAELYKNKVDDLYVKMGTLAQILMEGGDYSDAYDSASEAVSSMIDGYNSVIN